MDERKMILEMLKEGQITSEEAIRLLDALGAQDKGKGKPGKHEKLFTFDADKAKEGWEEVEKTIGGFVSNLANTVTNIFDEDLVFNFKSAFDSFTRRDERAMPAEGKVELEVFNKNGRIEILPTEEDTLVFESKVFHKNLEVAEDTRFYDIIEENGRIVYRAHENEELKRKFYVEVKLFVPKESLSRLELNTTNAALSVEGLQADDIRLITKNGKITAKQMSGDRLRMESSNARLELADSQINQVDLKTSNGKVTLEEIEADSIVVNTSNARIETAKLHAESISLSTSNGTVISTDIASERLEEGHFTCTNGKIELAFDEMNKEAELDLHTSMGNIDLQLPLALLYESNPSQNAKSVKAHTENYSPENGVSIFARTSNGNITLR